MTYQDTRIRFDDSFDETLDALRSEAKFEDLSSMALFACSLGFSQKVKFERRRGNRDVRLNLLRSQPGASDLFGMISICNAPAEMLDPLAKANVEWLAQEFEKYCNGGLSILSNQQKKGRHLGLFVRELLSAELKEGIGHAK